MKNIDIQLRVKDGEVLLSVQGAEVAKTDAKGPEVIEGKSEAAPALLDAPVDDKPEIVEEPMRAHLLVPMDEVEEAVVLEEVPAKSGYYGPM